MKSKRFILVLTGSCGIPVCEGDNEEEIKGASLINGQSVSGEEGVLVAGTSVFVLDPGQTPCKYRTVLFSCYTFTSCYSLIKLTSPVGTSHPAELISQLAR